MKFQVTFKDPDALYDAINDALDNEEFNGLGRVFNSRNWHRTKNMCRGTK